MRQYVVNRNVFDGNAVNTVIFDGDWYLTDQGQLLQVQQAGVTGSDSYGCAYFTTAWNTTGSPTMILGQLQGNVSGPGSKLMDLKIGYAADASKFAVFANSGDVSIGVNSPTAKLHIMPGSPTAGTAPLKLTPGTVLSTPEDGAIEYDGTDLYLTQSTTRYKLSKTLTGQLATNFGAPSLTAFNSVTTTLTVAGAQAGDVVSVSANSGAVNPPSIIITAYVTSVNTVTLQAYNASNSSVTLASDTYKVRVVR
jgi:hypothetical protein